MNGKGENILNLNHLEYFKVLAETQHMSKASEKLGISQPSLSYAIKKLEDELQVPLFEPDGRNIKLTIIGKKYYGYISDSLKSLDYGNKVVEQLKNPNTGHINLGFTYTLGQKLVPDIMTSFLNVPGNSEVSFSLIQDNSYNLLESLYHDELDMILASKVELRMARHSDEIFDFIPLVQQEIKLAVPKDHPLYSKKTISLNDLDGEDLITFSKHSGLNSLIKKILNQTKAKPNIKYELEEDHSIIGFVEHNMGIALVPNLPQLKQDKMALRSIEDNHLEHNLYLIISRNHFSPPSVHRFQNFALKYCLKNYINKNTML